ncbi:stage III sporulation protein AB [Bengtsoniella intestinalis]|uniref:stage III sporulation protein AB n=1 Tax=Bengtsoniella intestinalis TaxID=3073143 RepID=UPI00391EFCA4
MSSILGGLLIGLGCGGVWWIEIKSQRNKMDTMGNMASAMLEIRSEIQTNQTPLPRIFLRLSQTYTGVTGVFFSQVYQGIQAEKTLTESWEQAVNVCFLEGEIQDVLHQLGYTFSGDSEKICKVLLLVNDYFKGILTDIRSKMPEKRRSFGAMCFSGGALLLILLV